MSAAVLIPLGRTGRFAVVDLRDWPAVSRRSWFLKVDPSARRTAYAYCYERDAEGRRKAVLLHVWLWRLWRRKRAEVIDHRDGDGLNCRRENLRRATFAQNNANHPRRADNKSGCKGVDWDRRKARWRVRIQSNGVRQLVGHFSDLDGAIRCCERRQRAIHGRFARNARTTAPISDSPSLGSSPPPQAAHGADEQSGRSPSTARRESVALRAAPAAISAPVPAPLAGGLR